MSAPIDSALRLKQEANNVFYPRAMPVRVGDQVIIVRGEGRVKSGARTGHKISKIDRKKRKIYLENHTYFKSDGTELQKPIDPSNVVIINPDWTDLKRRKILDRINEDIDDEKVMEQIEEVEKEHEKEVAPSETSEEEVEKDMNYEDMNVAQLKEILSERGLPVSGKKADLIERIKEVAPIEKETENDVNYEDMNVAQLKEILKEKGLPVSGKKADLIERIKGGSDK